MTGWISMLCSFLVAITIYTNKKLRVHPNMLIAYMSIANFGSCWSSIIYTIGTHHVVCYLGMAQTLEGTMKIFNKDYTILDAVKLLSMTNIQWFEFFQMVAICMNIAMCVDLYFSYKNPFYPGSRRMKFYLIGTALCVVIIGHFESSWL